MEKIKERYTIKDLLDKVRTLKVPLKYRRILRKKVEFLGDEIDDRNLKKIIGEFENSKSSIELFINTLNDSKKNKRRKPKRKTSKRKTSK